MSVQGAMLSTAAVLSWPIAEAMTAAVESMPPK